MASDPAVSPQRISLSLTAAYAPSWGLWEGIRELVQNWHDGLLTSAPMEGPSMDAKPCAPEFREETSSDGAALRFSARLRGADVGFCEYLPSERKLVLMNRHVGLGRQVLLLGYSKKAQHADVIGSFGEGLKVGAVALLRNGLMLRMLTRSEAWGFQLLVDPAFGERVLTVEVSARPEMLDLEVEGLPQSLQDLSSSDTATILEGVKPEEWLRLSQRFLFLRPPRHSVRTEVGRLILDPDRAGNIFVKGVWINTDPDIAAGADLLDIRLDRDRAAVLKRSDLQHQVSSMWVRAVHHQPELQERYYDLLAGDRQCGDTALADLYCDDEVAEAMAAAFRKRHGDAIPVTAKDSNSTKAQHLRATLSTSLVVCNQALIAVLKKAGVRCDLEDVLQQHTLRARRAVPIAELSLDESACLAQACALVGQAGASPPTASLSAVVDVFDGNGGWSLDAIAAKAEAFAVTGRIELDRRALVADEVHRLLPEGRCFSPSGFCRCRQSMLASSILGLRAGSDKLTSQRLIARLAADAAVSEEGQVAQVLRFPDLGAERETALRKQIDALEKSLRDERDAHADELRALNRRVAEAEKDLCRAEFKFMDAADAERAVRDELEPQLARFRAEAAHADAARQALAEKADEAGALRRELGFLRNQAADLRQRLEQGEQAGERRLIAADTANGMLRRALARRREMLQRMLKDDPAAPLRAVAAEGPELWAAVEEIRTALREEASASLCCVCLDAEVNAVLLPCRHQQLCMTCAEALPRCPVCRAGICDRMRVFA